MDLSIGVSLLVMAIGIVWVIFYLYSKRMSQINGELRAITVILNEIPKEKSLQEYIVSQDQQLRSIGEKLDAHHDLALQQGNMPEHTKRLRMIISMLEVHNNTKLNRADLDNSLRKTNESLEKVLWSLRFDEDSYTESTAATRSRFAESGKVKLKSINNDGDAMDDANSMKAILKDSDNEYGAMLEYMKQTGKSGSNALHALDTVGGLHGR